MRATVGGVNLATNTANAISQILDDGRPSAASYTNALVSGTTASFYDLYTSGSVPCWFGYDFVTPQVIAEIIVVVHTAYVRAYPFIIEWSDDRTNWFAAGNVHDFEVEAVSETGCTYDPGTYVWACPPVAVGGTTTPWISMIVGA